MGEEFINSGQHPLIQCAFVNMTWYANCTDITTNIKLTVN